MSIASVYTPCFVMFFVFLYGPFCHGAQKLDLSTLFTTFIFLEHLFHLYYIGSKYLNKRAQRALGRSPEEKVKGHSGDNNREPQGHILNNFGRGTFDDVIY